MDFLKKGSGGVRVGVGGRGITRQMTVVSKYRLKWTLVVFVCSGIGAGWHSVDPETVLFEFSLPVKAETTCICQADTAAVMLATALTVL